MVSFCPTCGNHLVVGQSPNGGMNRFECRTCPYIYPIKETLIQRRALAQKAVDDILGGAGAWENVDQTAAQCPNTAGCEDGDRAYFFQLQIRSADEPMTTFYKCTRCGHQWKEN